MSNDTPEDLIYAAFFFIDIVGLSNPVLSTETQRTKIRVLNETIYNCNTFKKTPKEEIMILPTGDGMLIGFKNGLEQPINLAKEFHEKLSEYNHKVTNVEKIETRIGCNIGHVFVVKDIYGNVNLWGPGAILARRVMDLGDAGHILLSDEIVNDLIEIAPEYKEILHPLQNFGIKHGEDLLIYSAHGDGFGNPTVPKEKIKIKTDETEAEKSAICEKMIYKVILKDSLDVARFERYYYFSNNSNSPIYEITAGVVTNSDEEFHNLNLKAFDEKNKELEISKILASTPYSKKIVVKLQKPVFEGDSGRILKITYDANLKKKNFENFFLLDTSNFELNFNHYKNIKLSPKLFYIDHEKGSKNLIDKSLEKPSGPFITHVWNKTQGIKVKDLIRLEW